MLRGAVASGGGAERSANRFAGLPIDSDGDVSSSDDEGGGPVDDDDNADGGDASCDAGGAEPLVFCEPPLPPNVGSPTQQLRCAIRLRRSCL